jgi:peptidoglycan-N-acetylglucosamine deacetylase
MHFRLLLVLLWLPGFAFSADHTEQTEKAREAQKAYYRSGFAGQFADTCKYVSSIFEPAIPRVVHLTFDDGPSSVLTPKLLDILKEQNVPATFFVEGDRIAENRAILARAKAEGHLIGNHSWDHSNFHNLSQADQVSQVTTVDELIEPYTGNFKLFRYPYGNSTCFGNQKIHELGYTGIVGWHVDSCDWAYAANGGFVTDRQAQICEVEPQNKGHVLREVEKHGGGVILMHDVHANTVNSVREIILRLKHEGYSFMNLDDPRVSRFFK